MGTTHFALHQVQDVLHREREDIEEERLHLMEWGSLLKKWTTSEKQKAAERREWLDMKQSLLEETEIVIGELDAKAQKLMDDTKKCMS
jgi:hypothetical protein